MASRTIAWRVGVKPSPAEIAKAFGKLARRLNDWRPAWDLIAPILAEGTRAVFFSKGASIGEPWAPLTEIYARRKMREGDGRQPMVITRELRGSFDVISRTKKRLRFGTKMRQARAIHFGQGQRLMGWSDAMNAKASEIMTNHARHLMALAVDSIARGGA